jgi:hypothetical protein
LTAANMRIIGAAEGVIMATIITARRRARGGTDNGTILRTAISAKRSEFQSTA